MNNTLLKGLAVLELLSRSPRALTLTQIGKELGMGKSNVHRLMQALVETRFVLRDEETGTYTLSIKLWELGSAVLGKLDLRRHAERHMESLMELTGESVHLSVLDGLEAAYVHKVSTARARCVRTPRSVAGSRRKRPRRRSLGGACLHHGLARGEQAEYVDRGVCESEHLRAPALIPPRPARARQAAPSGHRAHAAASKRHPAPASPQPARRPSPAR